jgi:hypothetical protein
MRCWIPFVAALYAMSSSRAQAPVRVTARVVDRLSGQPIDGAGVRIDSISTVLSSVRGVLQIDLLPGTHTLTVGASGYTPWQRRFEITRDTTVTVDLGHEPFVLDTIRAVSKNVKAKLLFRDSSTRSLLVDVEVHTNRGERKTVGHTGRVTINIPFDEKTYLYSELFGYLPRMDTLRRRSDTSYTAWLRPDPVMTKMIEHQLDLIATRARTRPTAGARTSITGKELNRYSAGSLFLILQQEQMLRRVQCLVVDDVPHDDHMGMFPWRDRLNGILPDRVERVELLERGKMLRVYTRDFIRDLAIGRDSLVQVGFLAPMTGTSTSPDLNGFFCR